MKPALRQYFDHMIIAALAALCYALFFYGLGGIGLVGPDEPRYASIAREMLMTGGYITPRLYGAPWFEKPPLMYWLSAVGYKLFGNSEAAARFPSAVAMTLVLVLLSLVLYRFIGPERTVWTVFVFAASGLTIMSAKMCLTDATLLVWIVTWFPVLALGVALLLVGMYVQLMRT